MEAIQIDMQNQQQKYAYELIANTNSSFFLTGREEPERLHSFAKFRSW